jgi:hypothetical protein
VDDDVGQQPVGGRCFKRMTSQEEDDHHVAE